MTLASSLRTIATHTPAYRSPVHQTQVVPRAMGWEGPETVNASVGFIGFIGFRV